jgi:hypothetical protein
MPITRIFSITNDKDEELAIVTLSAKTVEFSPDHDEIELFGAKKQYAGTFTPPPNAKIREVGK